MKNGSERRIPSALVASQFIATIDKYKPGQKVTLSITRSGQSKQVKVTLATRPAQTPNGG